MYPLGNLALTWTFPKVILFLPCVVILALCTGLMTVPRSLLLSTEQADWLADVHPCKVKLPPSSILSKGMVSEVKVGMMYSWLLDKNRFEEESVVIWNSALPKPPSSTTLVHVEVSRSWDEKSSERTRHKLDWSRTRTFETPCQQRMAAPAKPKRIHNKVDQ